MEIDFLTSRNVFRGAVLLFIKYFLISRIWFLDIKNLFLDIKKWNLFLDIKKWNSWYQEIKFLISRNRFLDIKNSFSWYISRIPFLDIKKSISWYQEIVNIFLYMYQEIDFLISRIQFLDIKKYLINSKTAPQNTFLDIISSQISIKLAIITVFGPWSSDPDDEGLGGPEYSMSCSLTASRLDLFSMELLGRG